MLHKARGRKALTAESYGETAISESGRRARVLYHTLGRLYAISKQRNALQLGSGCLEL
jgi:hypothetical protein